MDYFKRSYGNKVGIGGWKCSCCGPSRKDKSKWRRYARRRDNQKVRMLCGQGTY